MDGKNPWEAILPILLGVLLNPAAPASAKQQAEGELTRMAVLADTYVSLRSGAGREDLLPRLGDPDEEAH